MNLNVISKQQKEEIIKFYLVPNSLICTANQFNLSKYLLKKFLAMWGVELHSKEINAKIQSIKHIEIQLNKKSQGYQSIKINVEEISKSILDYFGSLENIQTYWKTHSRREIDIFSKNNFNISYYLFSKIVLNVFNLNDRTKEESMKINKKHVLETNLKKYGCKVPYLYDSKEFKELMMKKYGVDNYFKTDECKKIVHDRCFGVPLKEETKHKLSESIKSKESQEKLKRTNLEKYGVEYTFQSVNNKEKSKKTLIKKYGMAHAPKKIYCVNGVYLDSLPEVAFYLWALNNGDLIERCPLEYKYEVNGEEYNYHPDFVYNNEIVEIKGPQFVREDGTWFNPYSEKDLGQMEAKHQCAIKNKIRIIYEEEYQMYLNWYYKQGYKKDEFKVK